MKIGDKKVNLGSTRKISENLLSKATEDSTEAVSVSYHFLQTSCPQVIYVFDFLSNVSKYKYRDPSFAEPTPRKRLLLLKGLTKALLFS